MRHPGPRSYQEQTYPGPKESFECAIPSYVVLSMFQDSELASIYYEFCLDLFTAFSEILNLQVVQVTFFCQGASESESRANSQDRVMLTRSYYVNFSDYLPKSEF
jgi:hypothetical protein